jgi:hypothetical protein
VNAWRCTDATFLFQELPFFVSRTVFLCIIKNYSGKKADQIPAVLMERKYEKKKQPRSQRVYK